MFESTVEESSRKSVSQVRCAHTEQMRAGGKSGIVRCEVCNDVREKDAAHDFVGSVFDWPYCLRSSDVGSSTCLLY